MFTAEERNSNSRGTAGDLHSGKDASAGELFIPEIFSYNQLYLVEISTQIGREEGAVEKRSSYFLCTRIFILQGRSRYVMVIGKYQPVIL